MSSFCCKKYIEDEGGNVALVLSVFSYGFEATEAAFRDLGVVHKTLCNFSQLREAVLLRAAASQSDLGTVKKLDSWYERTNELLINERKWEAFMREMRTR